MSNPTPKVTLLSWTRDPLETVYAVWEQSKNEQPLMTIEDVKRNVPPAEVEKLFRAVIAQKIPIGEHISFIFILENVSISWREQAVRHRIGTLASPERVGADMVHMDILPDLADSSWWSQCFTGDTRVRLLDGTMPTMAELAERDGRFWVHSCDAAGRIVPGLGHSARKTGTKALVEVELDNGERIRCTPDHLWLGRDGRYIEARDLSPGTSLMPLVGQEVGGASSPGPDRKVAAMRELNEMADVYDITVEEHHNFALAAGVFVHNSMRIQDMSAFARRRMYRLPQTVADKGPEAEVLFHKTMEQIGNAYNQLVDMGVPMEDARELMPLGAQHRMSWMLNIGSLQHIVGKRGCWILQLGIWGPIIEGMVAELAQKVHPIFSEIVTPPCLKGDDYTGCVYQEEVRRRYTGDDKLPPCPLHFHHEVASEAERKEGLTRLPVLHEGYAVPRAAEMRARAEQYRAFWGRDPYSGKRLHALKS